MRRYFGPVEGMSDIINRSEAQAAQLLFGLKSARQQDHGDVPQEFVVPELSAYAEAIPFLQAGFKNDQAGLPGFSDRERALTVGGEQSFATLIRQSVN
ncbi:MAG: hypothetical protein ABSG46_15960 [Candidatus Binataceae bacterium]